MSNQTPIDEFSPAVYEAVAEEFALNPEPRCPSLLLLDVSASMSGERLEQLVHGLDTYQRELAGDSQARKKVEVAVVTFGGKVSIAQDFTSAQEWVPPALKASGATPMGEALVTGLDLLRKRKETLRRSGLELHRPWVFLITDGEPTDKGTPFWREARERLLEGQQNQSFLFFSVGVSGANLDVLGELSQVTSPMSLKGVRFADLFRWLSDSQKSVAASRPGDRFRLALPACIDITV